MSRHPIGIALSALSRFAGSDFADRLRLRKPSEKIAYLTTRTGYRVLSSAAQELKRLERLLPATRLPKSRASDLFDLSLSDEQQMIQDSLRRLAQDEIRPLAAQADEAGVLPPSVHQQGIALGLLQFGVPEAFHGMAHQQSPVTSTLIAETLAWGDMGIASALLASCGVAQAISRWGSGRQQTAYLPLFAGESPPLATLAVDEPRPLFDPLRLNTHASRQGDHFVLEGVKCAVPFGQTAEFLLIAAQVAEVGPRLFLLETNTPGVRVEADVAMGLRAAGLGRIHLDRVRLPQSALLGEDGDFDYNELLDLASLMRCALAVGTSQAVLDYVIPYCNDRQAFGEAISHRQAVAFMIADMALEIDAMRLLTWRAASRAEQGLPFHREAYLARQYCNDKAMQIGSNGVQLLGGHGFVKEHPVERWYRDLRSVAVLHGGLHA